MSRNGASRFVWLGLLAVLVVPVVSSAASPSYNITDLGTLGGTQSRAFSLNDSGQVCGWAYVTGGYGTGVSHAFAYTSGTGMTDLGTLGGTNSGAYGTGNGGHIVGGSWLTTDPNNLDRHAFLDDGTGMQDLGTLGGTESGAYAVTSAGKVVGWANNSLGQYRAFIYDPTSKAMSDLGALLGGTLSCAQGVNDNDQVVGYSGVSGDTTYHAFLYSAGTMTDLGMLPGGTYSQCWSINNSGVIVGSSEIAGGAGTHPFVYQNGTMADIAPPGTPPSISEAYGINNAGDVVGTMGGGGGGYYAFLRTAGGNFWDLNSLLAPSGFGWTLFVALDINNSGQIAGYGRNPAGQEHGFLLTLVPEPATLSLLALTGLAVIRKRRY